jgi:aromatic ring-opening dioxygenase LigB subunit
VQQAGWSGAAIGLACDADATLPAGDLEPGEADGLLVMGDGSARRTEKAPGWLDERAAGFDAASAAALASGNPEQLRQIDQELGRELLAAGAPAWRAAARLLAHTAWEGAVSYDDAPYGVGYLVAVWSARRQG